MKLFKLCGHNPDSKSAKERARKRKLPLLDVVKCCKCKSSDRQLYKTQIDGKEAYICNTCLEIRNRKERIKKYGR